MKKLMLLAAILIVSASSPVFGQKIVLKIPNVTVVEGEEIRALEWNVTSATSWTTGGGAAVGKPDPGQVIFKYTHGKSSDILFRRLAQGTSFAELSVEYYETNTSKTPYYTLKFGGVFVTKVGFLSPECPTCVKLEHQVGMVFKTVELTDAINGTYTKWDVSTMTVTL